MYGIFMESWVILKNYGGTGFLLLLYVIALGYLLIREKNKYVRSIFVYAPMLLIFGFLFPVSRKLYVAVLNEGNTYYRVLWLLPVSITLAYTGCSVIYRLGKRFEKYARWHASEKRHLEANGGKPAEICAFFDGRSAFLQDAEARYAVAKMQDELQENLPAIHKR